MLNNEQIESIGNQYSRGDSSRIAKILNDKGFKPTRAEVYLPYMIVNIIQQKTLGDTKAEKVILDFYEKENAKIFE